MNAIKNILAAIGVVAIFVLIINTAQAGAGLIVDAFDRQQAGEAAIIAEHKAYIAGNDIGARELPSGTDAEYEASEQYKVAQHANRVLASARGKE